MNKKTDIIQEIIYGIREAGGGKRYTINITDNAKAVREKLGAAGICCDVKRKC